MYKIMALDDDEFILAALKRSLRHKKDWQVDLYSDAVDAIQQAKRHSYDLFLSDYQMPKMDGMTFLTIIKDMQPLSKRIMLSGDGGIESSSHEKQQAGIFRFLTKPVPQDELITVIHEALDDL